MSFKYTYFPQKSQISLSHETRGLMLTMRVKVNGSWVQRGFLVSAEQFDALKSQLGKPDQTEETGVKL